jgi:hypothetical protein
MMDNIGRRAATKFCHADANNLNPKLDTEEECPMRGLILGHDNDENDKLGRERIPIPPGQREQKERHIISS